MLSTLRLPSSTSFKRFLMHGHGWISGYPAMEKAMCYAWRSRARSHGDSNESIQHDATTSVRATFKCVTAMRYPFTVHALRSRLVLKFFACDLIPLLSETANKAHKPKINPEPVNSRTIDKCIVAVLDVERTGCIGDAADSTKTVVCDTCLHTAQPEAHPSRATCFQMIGAWPQAYCP